MKKILLLIAFILIAVCDSYAQEIFNPIDTGTFYSLEEYELVGFRIFFEGRWTPEFKKKSFPEKEYEPVIMNGDTVYWREKQKIRWESLVHKVKIFRKNPKEEGEE